MSTAFLCCSEERREAVAAQSAVNGIAFLEVLDDPLLPDADRQRTLEVHFVHPVAAGSLGAPNVRIEGGERVRNIAVESAAASGDLLTVVVSAAGDFSTYTLRLVRAPDDPRPPLGYDPILSAVEFSFKAGCESDFDCRATSECTPAPAPAPELDYLARDYASFRRLMLDRLALLVPEWTERNPADLGIVLVEALAHVGDQLSYRQDAIATEAYLGTARRRVSVRRHARLVDYFMHDGCNARTWVQVRASADGVPLPKGTKLLTRVEGAPPRLVEPLPPLDPASRSAPVVFETMHDATLFEAHNVLRFHTWGDRECCLPRGATRATLRGALPGLHAGDVLVFAEARGPRTGRVEDADPTRRHAVRLTSVEAAEDPIGGQFETPPTAGAVPVTEIAWSADDALPFPLCVSAVADDEHGGGPLADVSLAHGNVVLADHGLTVEDEPLGAVPPGIRAPAVPAAHCDDAEAGLVPPRFRPTLARAPVTHAVPFGAADLARPARAAMRAAPDEALPAATLATPGGSPAPWLPRRDLLQSGADKRHFVVETEEDGTASLRFGDDAFGLRPASGAAFTATYRVGNGAGGNVGADTLVHVASADASVVDVWNPLPATGGAEPESVDLVRQNAPVAFRRQERAVTPADYAEVAERHAEVQRAAATFRWTGSWRTVFLTVDRRGGRPVDAAFVDEMRAHLERYRMAGHDVAVDGPRFVSLEIAMRVCAAPDHFRGDVKADLLRLFGRGTLPDGRRGVFHPDEFTFAQPVYLSRLYAAAQGVPGVRSVEITTFQQQGRAGQDALDLGRLDLARLEIARLDNDPNFPERGVFTIAVEGGK